MLARGNRKNMSGERGNGGDEKKKLLEGMPSAVSISTGRQS